jgi:hypothetical protein
MGRIKRFQPNNKTLRIPAMDRDNVAQKKYVKKPNNEALRIPAMDRTSLCG